MPRTIDELLASVDAELALMDDARPAPATEADIAQATGWISERYDAKTPTGLENFWRDHNGLDFDGGPDQSFATFEEFLTNMLEEAAA